MNKEYLLEKNRACRMSPDLHLRKRKAAMLLPRCACEAPARSDALRSMRKWSIMLLECSQLNPTENAAVLATSGFTTKKGSTTANSYVFEDKVWQVHRSVG